MEQATETPDRLAGVCLHLPSLPGEFGIGELGDAAHRFVESVARMNLRLWQILPTGPTGYGDSPYQPLSTFAGNEMLIDVRWLVRAGLIAADEARCLEGLSSEAVDYGALIPRKLELLQRAAGRFQGRADASLKTAFEDFLHDTEHAWLHDYAMFRVLKTLHRERAWPEWSPRFARRDKKALEEIASRHATAIRDVKVLQFVFDRQWRELHEFARAHDVRLFGDMPIGVALDSADVWACREIVSVDENGNPDRVAGVPPDYFSEDGQLWGNPIYDWDAHRASGYGWWIERLRHAVGMVDLVRIDHFRGFESYWAVPASAESARNGEWLPGPGDDFFRVIRAAIGDLPIVAEDLGVITPEVEDLRRRNGIPGMTVLQFELGNESFDIADIDLDCACFTGTHDNDTTRGWFLGSPGDLRPQSEIQRTRELALQFTGGSPETIHLDVIRLALRSPARIAIAPLQDFLGLGSDARLNIPGTSSGNWRWRLEAESLSPELEDSVAESVSDAGRLPAV